MKFKLCPEIHPVLFSIAPALLLVSNNLGEALLSDAIVPMGVTFLGVLFMYVCLSFFLKDRKKVAIIISIFLLVFFSFGHVHDSLRYYFTSPIIGVLIKPRFLLLIFGSFFILITCLIIRSVRNLDQWTIFLNYMSLALVIIPLVQVGGYFLQANLARNKFNEMSYKAVVTGESKIRKVFPDIYYIILDAYANESTLKNYLKYDNRYFIDFLKGKGFYVASKSRSNYASTVVSLPSALNMEYINHLSKMAGRKSTDRYYAWKMVDDNKVMRFLKSKGYKIINFNSTMHPTRKLNIADVNVHCTHTKEFNSIYIQTTLYYAFEKYFHLVDDKRKHILCTFSEIAKYSKIPGPKFIFAHMLIPHDPYVFGPNGEPVQDDETQDPEIKNKRYLGQLTFANKKVMELIEQILPESPPLPIIILQSDHGPNLPSLPNKVFVRERMKNLNAYYLPGKGRELLYDSVTPVNTFRLVFNQYFNADFSLLKDQSFYSGLNIYDFKEVVQEESIESQGN